MALRSRQKVWHKIVFSWVTILILLLISILLLNSIFDMYKKNTRAADRAQDSLIELTKVEERKDSLSKNLEHIKTTKGIEEELRRKFDVALEGEHLLVIVDKEVKPDIQDVKESWLDNLWHKLLK